MELIVERISEDIVTLEKEDRTHFCLSYSELKLPIHVGDVLRFEDGIYAIDEQETQKRRQKMQEKTRKLFKK